MDALNMTMHIFCMVLMIALIVSQLLRKMNDLQNRLFLVVLIIMFFTIGGDWGVHFLDACGYGPGIVYTVKTAVVILNAVQYPVLFLYLLMNEADEKAPFQKSMHIILSASAISLSAIILYLLIPLWNNPVFTLVFADETTGYLFFSKLAILIEHLLLAGFVSSQKGKYLIYGKQVFYYALTMIFTAVIDIGFTNFDFCCAVSVLTVLSIYLNFQLNTEKRMESSKLSLLNSRIFLILSKISPDLVSDVLKEIETLCQQDTEKAQNAISLLSDYLRGSIERIDTNDMIPFDEELDHIQKYAELLRLTEHPISVRYDLRYRGFFVPVRTVCPLVEEFVEGGIAEQREKTCVHISTQRNGNECIVDVSGPARTHIHDMKSAMNHYEMIFARLSQFEGTSLRLYCTREGILHAVACYPLKRKVKDDA